MIPDEGISAEDRDFLRQCFRGEITGKDPCEWCGGLHERKCRRVKRITYHASGERVSEVEFWPDGSWDESAIVWPEDVF